MMRTIATQLLVGMVRRTSGEGRAWGEAMLREMDFVDDGSAMRWALGSASALCRRSMVQMLRRFVPKMPAMITGMAAASLVLAACILVLSWLLRATWFDPALAKFADRVLFVVVPEALYVAAAIALWRRRRGVALGILAAAAVLIAHAVVHFVTHS
jgi:hypothetical protein